MKIRFLIIIFLLSITQPAFCFIIGARSYAKVSEDETKMLVIIVQFKNPDYKEDPVSIILPDGRTIDVLSQFQTSGIYDIHTLDKISEIDWYCREDFLLWNENFSSMVILNHLAVFRAPGLALAFVRDGKITKTYDLPDLLKSLRHPLFLPYESYDWHHRWYDKFERADSILHLSTAKRTFLGEIPLFDLGVQEFYEFDFTSGDLISQRVENTKLKAMIALIILILLLSLGGAIFWVRRQQKLKLLQIDE